MRLRNPATGVVVNVADERGKQLQREGYQPVGKSDAAESPPLPTSAAPAKKTTARRRK